MKSKVTESVEYGDEARGVEETRGLGDDGRTKGKVVDKDGGARRGPGKADCLKKSGEKGLTYRWSRNLTLRWQQQQRRGRSTHLGTCFGGGEGGIRSIMGRRERAGNHRRAGRWKQREGGKRMG